MFLRFSLILALLIPSLLYGGEWMFRLRSAHVDIRQALFAKDADAAWEHVDRETRQSAGLLAAHIRNQAATLSDEKKAALLAKLGSTDPEALSTIQGKHLLVSKFFLEAHPYMFLSTPDDTKLKDHGTKMAGPTGIVIRKNTPEAVTVPYTFTAENHFGGQAMDYRAKLTIPSLEAIIGKTPEPKPLPKEEYQKQSVETFQKAQQAFKEGDLDTLWTLLDCDSQSQASHFADQAHEQSGKSKAKTPGRIEERLGISTELLTNLDGKQVWALPWTKDKLSSFSAGKAIGTYEGKTGNRGWDPGVEIESNGKKHRIPFRVNYRNGIPEVKIFLRPPLYTLLRVSNDWVSNNYTTNYGSVASYITKNTEFKEGDPAAHCVGIYSDGKRVAELVDRGYQHYHILFFPNGRKGLRTSPQDYTLINGLLKEDGTILFQPENPVYGIKEAIWKDGQLTLVELERSVSTLPKVNPSMPSTPAPEGATVLFDGNSIDAWESVQLHKVHKILTGVGGSQTKQTFGSFQLHLEFINVLERDRPLRSPSSIQYGPLQIELRDSFGMDYDEHGALGPIRPIFTKRHKDLQGKKYDSYVAKSKDRPPYVCGRILVNRKSLSADQTTYRPNHCLPPLVNQTLDLQVLTGSTTKVTLYLNGKPVYKNIEIEADTSTPAPIQISTKVPYRNIWVKRL